MDKWTPEETLDLMTDHGVTALHLVPTMFSRLLALPEERKETFDPSGIVMALHGAAPSSEGWLERPGTVGTAPVVGRRGGGRGGNELPPGQTGTIYFRTKLGPTCEYYKAPEKTAQAHRGKDMFTLEDVG